MSGLLEYLREKEVEDFSPKEGKNPRKEKYLDSRKARRQNVKWLSRAKDIDVWLNKNGLIWFISYKTKQPKCLPNGWRRNKKKFSYNGVYERGYEDVRWMRNGWGKQSRQSQRLWLEVEEQVQDYFAEKRLYNENY